MSTELSRRTIAKGTAWSIPALAVAASAPALAASSNPVLNANNSVTWNELPDGTQTDDNLWRVYSAPDGNVQPPNSVATCGPEVTGANSSTKVTSVSMTFWLPDDSLTFENNSEGPATSGWTTLARDTGADNGSTDTEGAPLYAYSTQYTGPIALTKGTTTICLGIQNWVSTDSDEGVEPATYNANLTALVNGQPQSDPGNDIAISEN